MHVLIITQIYAPEMGAPTARLTSLAQGLISRGHKVSVATGMPNYPAGVVFPEYRKRWLCRDHVDGVTVSRCTYYTTPRNRSRWKQLFSYLTFLPAGLFAGLRCGPIDVVIVSSPPIFPVLTGRILSIIRRAKLVYDVRDLWPDEIVACGGARDNSLPIRLIRGLERMIYKRAKRILCTTRSFMNIIRERGATDDQLRLIPNGADVTRFYPGAGNQEFRDENRLAGRFVVLYSGVLGLKHGLDVIIRAAGRLQDESNIRFVFVGDGAGKPALKSLAEELKLTNVCFCDPVSSDKVADVVRTADLCVTSLETSPYLQNILAVKIFEYLACGKAIVAAVNGESRKVIEESGAGIAVTPGDDEALASAIHDIFVDDARRTAMEAAGPPFILEHFSRQQIAERCAAELESLVGVDRGDRP